MMLLMWGEQDIWCHQTSADGAGGALSVPFSLIFWCSCSAVAVTWLFSSCSVAMTSTSFGMVRSPALKSIKAGHSAALAMVLDGELLLLAAWSSSSCIFCIIISAISCFPQDMYIVTIFIHLSCFLIRDSSRFNDAFALNATAKSFVAFVMSPRMLLPLLETREWNGNAATATDKSSNFFVNFAFCRCMLLPCGGTSLFTSAFFLSIVTSLLLSLSSAEECAALAHTS